MENIIINTKLGFQQLIPIEGYVITDYKESDDISNYYSTTEIDAPISADLSKYRAISLEQDSSYKKRKEEKRISSIEYKTFYL